MGRVKLIFNTIGLFILLFLLLMFIKDFYISKTSSHIETYAIIQDIGTISGKSGGDYTLQYSYKIGNKQYTNDYVFTGCDKNILGFKGNI